MGCLGGAYLYVDAASGSFDRSIAEHFQAREIWHRLVVAAAQVPFLAWNSHMSKYSASQDAVSTFSGMGLREDLTPDSSPPDIAAPRQSWWALVRAAEKFCGRVSAPPPALDVTGPRVSIARMGSASAHASDYPATAWLPGGSEELLVTRLESVPTLAEKSAGTTPPTTTAFPDASWAGASPTSGTSELNDGKEPKLTFTLSVSDDPILFVSRAQWAITL